MKISILDCTLRDGGYVNDFNFGSNNIQRLKEGLTATNIEIIECGFLQSGKFDSDYALYGSVESIKLPPHKNDTMFVAMITFGDISADEITPYKEGFIDGIRLTFHNSEWQKTKELAQNLMGKGYKVFIQPVGTISYTDEELIKLINEVNELSPFSFYLVDTLGSMYKNDLLRLFYLVEHNLSENIAIGFHSHNNMQLSFSNAMHLLELHTKRHIIIDSSVFGMGRGAGNLNTELITHFINENITQKYQIMPLLELMDDIILPIYKYSPWGFSEPYYMAAIRGVHPSYASYLIDKKSMSMTVISKILDCLPFENRHLFNKSYIEKIYHSAMSNDVKDDEVITFLIEMLRNKNVLIIVPGQSVKTNDIEISKFISEYKPFIISINFVPKSFTPNLVFIGNQKRYDQLPQANCPIAVTSNIKSQNAFIVNYDTLLTDGSDSSGLMILQLLIRIGITHAYLAGYDGFTSETSYSGKDLENYLSNDAMTELNADMSQKLAIIQKKLALKFITPSIYNI